MSLAPASIRGAFLKARLAVNGIQWAARSFGTLTAGALGLLSSIGASLNGLEGVVALQAISFSQRRERQCLAIFGPFAVDCCEEFSRGPRPWRKTPRLPNLRYRARAAAAAERRPRHSPGRGRSRRSGRLRR